MLTLMPPKDSDEWGEGDGPEDEAANIQMSSLWGISRTFRKDGQR